MCTFRSIAVTTVKQGLTDAKTSPVQDVTPVAVLIKRLTDELLDKKVGEDYEPKKSENTLGKLTRSSRRLREEE
jgi:hypothetical protein